MPETLEAKQKRKDRDAALWAAMTPEQRLASSQAHKKYLQYNVAPGHARRSCLFCGEAFESSSPFNRRCEPCETHVQVFRLA